MENRSKNDYDLDDLDEEFRLMIANDKKVWIKILDLVTKLATNDPGLMRLKTMLPKVQNCDTYLTYWNIIKTKSIQKSLPAIEGPDETITETTAAESDIEVIQTGEEEQEENATVSIQEMSDLSDALSPEALAQAAALRALYAQSAKKRSSTALSSSEQLSPPSFYVPPKKRFIEVTRNSPNKRVTRQNLQVNTQHTGITPFTHEILMTEADKSFTRNLLGPGSAAENLAPAPVEPTILEEVDEDIQVVSEFVNKRGTDQFPFLVAILLNGNNPRFCVNVDGYLRSCRPCHINMSKMELLIFCTRGREGVQCRGKHKLRVKHKEMVLKEKDFSKRYPRNKLRLNIERPDLIYDTKNYEVVPYFSSQHTCEHPISFKSIKAVKDGQITIKELLPTSRKHIEKEMMFPCKTEIIDSSYPLPPPVTRPPVDNRCRPSNLPVIPFDEHPHPVTEDCQ